MRMKNVLIIAMMLFMNSVVYSQSDRGYETSSNATYLNNVLCHDNYYHCAKEPVRIAFDNYMLKTITSRHIGVQDVFIIYDDALEFALDINREYQNQYMIEDYNFRVEGSDLRYVVYVIYEKDSELRKKQLKDIAENK